MKIVDIFWVPAQFGGRKTIPVAEYRPTMTCAKSTNHWTVRLLPEDDGRYGIQMLISEKEDELLQKDAVVYFHEGFKITAIGKVVN